MFDPNTFPTHMIIKSAKYVKKLPGSSEYDTVAVVVDRNGVDETLFVPIDPNKVNSEGTITYVGNIHYAEIKRQVDAGELTIEDAD